jgi:nitroimidazol reductase NimA-like FMN-containing flavoprotein (pyridoxamine 5'-phosphate oxidase superfamily)
MYADDAPVTVLSEDECWSLLSSMSLGRVVTILGGKPEIFPVNFVIQRRTVLFRTAHGTKLYSAVMGGSVAFEADYHDAPLTYGWSVIIKGRAQVLSANADILDAEEAPLRS